MGEIENKVDCLIAETDLIKAVSLDSVPTTKRRMKKSKTMLKFSPVSLVLFVIAIGVVGMLVFGLYTGSQTGDLDLSGTAANIRFDGDLMTVDSFVIPMDLSAMAPGDSFSFAHTAEADASNGDWDLSFDASAIRDFDPADEWYGFYFDIVDSSDVSILDETIYLESGAGVFDMEFVYELDEFFATPSGLFPYALDVIITRHENWAPFAVDDEFVKGSSGQILDVLANDYDVEGDDMLITEITGELPSEWVSAIIVGTYPDQTIMLTYSVAWDGERSMQYTIEDPEGLSDTATFTLTSTL